MLVSTPLVHAIEHLVAGRVVIFDSAGRRVREMDWPAWATARSWDGRDDHGRAVANGVYHARLELGPHQAQTRIVRVR